MAKAQGKGKVDDPKAAGKRRKVEAMLWLWGEEARRPGHVASHDGYPSASPTYRMMRRAQPAAPGRSGTCDMWRQRQRRVGQGAHQRLELEHPQTVYGRESKAAVFDEFTQPELDADRGRLPVDMITGIVMYALSDEMRAIVEVRFIDRIERFREIVDALKAEFPSLTVNNVPALYDSALQIVQRQLLEAPKAARRSIAATD